MTEEEKDRLIAAKREVTAHLAALDMDALHLSAVDPRLDKYVRMVATDPEGHNLYEQLAVSRFVRMYHKYGLSCQPVWQFMALYESLSFPGKGGMRTYELTPVQVFQYVNIFGFWDNGRRVVREAVLFVPRKFSKTTSSAALAIHDLLFGDANAESYTGANSQDQAKKCFDVIRGAMRRLDPQGRRYVVNEQVIKSLRPDRQAFAQCLTANARTKDGLNASTVIMDEFSQARDNDLLTVLTTSMGVRENPLTMIITTASDVFDGPFYEMLQGYKSILLGDYDDDSVFAHLFEPDIGDDEADERTWRKVQPHMGVTVGMHFYRDEYQKARRNGAGAMLAFRTKLLNVYTENSQKLWIGAGRARTLARELDLSALRGRPDSMVAIDLSERDDFSAVTVGIYDSRAHSFHFHTDYFFPEGALTDHPNERLYRLWAEQGHLWLTQGDVIDYRAIVDHVLWLNERTRVLGVGYDPWKSHEMINILASSGARSVIRPVRQTYGYFTAPVDSFEHAAFTGRLSINPNPINYYCFGNAVLDVDGLENKKPVKRKPNHKIDGVITTLMCLRLFIDHER